MNGESRAPNRGAKRDGLALDRIGIDSRSRPCGSGLPFGIPSHTRVPRLDQLLASNLDLSRRQVSKLLSQGAIADVQGETLHDGASAIQTPCTVMVRGQVTPLHETAAVLLHKPLGCVTALRDSRHPTAYEFLQNAPLFRLLRPIGRLDLNTSGLLLWTTQGEQVHAMTHPKRAVPRCYHVGLHRPHTPRPPDLVLKDGHRPSVCDLVPLTSEQVHPALDLSESPACFASITLQGGAYHEVRRIFAALGSHVLSLCRVQHGPWTLPRDLPAGHFKRIDLEHPEDSTDPVAG